MKCWVIMTHVLGKQFQRPLPPPGEVGPLLCSCRTERSASFPFFCSNEKGSDLRSVDRTAGNFRGNKIRRERKRTMSTTSCPSKPILTRQITPEIGQGREKTNSRAHSEDDHHLIPRARFIIGCTAAEMASNTGRFEHEKRQKKKL